MFTWPKSLVAELAERRAILVLGAGASADSVGIDGKTHPPDWNTLLVDAANLITDAPTRKFALTLISHGQFLDAAELIVRSTNPPDFTAFIRDKFQTPGYKESPIHKLVVELDPKIVITTNYDEIYENYCKQGRATVAYNTCRYYDGHALNDIRSITRVILKIHGCVSDPSQVILSRTQYFKARQRFPGFYSILDALFLTGTLLFIGCSLSDPDLQLLLENANIRAASNHPHYAIVADGKPAGLIQTLKDVHNIQVLEYAAGKHDEVVEALQILREEVTQWRKTHP